MLTSALQRNSTCGTHAHAVRFWHSTIYCTVHIYTHTLSTVRTKSMLSPSDTPHNSARTLFHDIASQARVRPTTMTHHRRHREQETVPPTSKKPVPLQRSLGRSGLGSTEDERKDDVPDEADHVDEDGHQVGRDQGLPHQGRRQPHAVRLELHVPHRRVEEG